jgi:hypothetical protein
VERAWGQTLAGWEEGEFMLLVEDSFKAILGAHSPEALDAEAATVIGLWPDGRIALTNSAWQTFALANTGADVLRRWPLGASFHSGVSDALRDYYARAFAHVLERREAWAQNYECHSPELARQFRLQVLPLGGHGLLLTHSLLVEIPMSEKSVPLHGMARYRGPRGVVRQCSNCRRTQRAGSPEVWDWVPQFVLDTPRYVSHGICTTWINQYYPEL